MAPASKKVNLKDKVEDGEIDLSMMDLQDVPVKDIATIRKAHTLDLSNNHIIVLPKNFATLVHLIKIDLSKNELKELPENFGELVKLKHLDLYKNNLQHLPLSFSKLKALKWLDLKDNPLVPAIANVAGPCLESKQCEKCARDIVSFYSELEVRVEEEKKSREEQRQKSMQANAAQKLKQEKKNKKDKKDKAKRSKENGQVSEGASKAPVSESSGDPVSADNRNQSKGILSVIFGFIKFFFMVLVILGLLIFILTAAKVEFVKILEDKAVEVWNITIKQLPPNLQGFGVQAGENIKHIHNLTAQGVVTLTGYVCDLTKNRSINIIFTEVSEVVKNVTQTASEFYLKVFGK